MIQTDFLRSNRRALTSPHVAFFASMLQLLCYLFSFLSISFSLLSLHSHAHPTRLKNGLFSYDLYLHIYRREVNNTFWFPIHLRLFTSDYMLRRGSNCASFERTQNDWNVYRPLIYLSRGNVVGMNEHCWFLPIYQSVGGEMNGTKKQL